MSRSVGGETAPGRTTSPTSPASPSGGTADAEKKIDMHTLMGLSLSTQGMNWASLSPLEGIGFERGSWSVILESSGNSLTVDWPGVKKAKALTGSAKILTIGSGLARKPYASGKKKKGDGGFRNRSELSVSKTGTSDLSFSESSPGGGGSLDEAGLLAGGDVSLYVFDFNEKIIFETELCKILEFKSEKKVPNIFCIGVGDDPSKLTYYEFATESNLDAYFLRGILNAVISNKTAALIRNALHGLPIVFAQAIHKGVVTVPGMLSSKELFMVLFPGKVLCFKYYNTGYPVWGTSTVGAYVVAKEVSEDFAEFQLVSKNLTGTFKTHSQLSRNRWLAAFRWERENRTNLIPTRYAGFKDEYDAKSEDTIDESIASVINVKFDARFEGDLSLFWDEGQFFRFMRTVMQPHNILHTTTITDSIEEWDTNSKVSGSRKSILKSVDHFADVLHYVSETTTSLIRNCYVASFSKDEDNAMQNQLDFAFPDFERETFSIGPVAVVAAKKMFRSEDYKTFQDSEWDGALKSSSIGKELMQSCPDVTDLFEKGEGDRAREIMASSTKELITFVSLAQYINLHRDILIREGPTPRFRWGDVVGEVTKNVELLNSVEKPDKEMLFNPAPGDILSAVFLEGNKMDAYEDGCVCTPVHFVKTLLFICLIRINAVRDVEQAIKNYVTAKKETDATIALGKACEQERKAIEEVMKILPSAKSVAQAVVEEFRILSARKK